MTKSQRTEHKIYIYIYLNKSNSNVTPNGGVGSSRQEVLEVSYWTKKWLKSTISELWSLTGNNDQTMPDKGKGCWSFMKVAWRKQLPSPIPQPSASCGESGPHFWSGWLVVYTYMYVCMYYFRTLTKHSCINSIFSIVLILFEITLQYLLVVRFLSKGSMIFMRKKELAIWMHSYDLSWKCHVHLNHSL